MNHLIDFIYPPLCLHCQTKTEQKRHLLCPTCLEHLALLDPKQHCRNCLKAVEGKPLCSDCWKKPRLFKACTGACCAMGPARTLFTRFQKGDENLAPALGSLMAMQMSLQNWPQFDRLIPLPESAFQHRNLLLAREIGKIQGVPVSTPLRRSWNYSFLFDEEQGKTYRFHLKNPEQVCDKRVLLIAAAYESEPIVEAGQ